MNSGEIIGESKVVREMRASIGRVAQLSTPVLVQGATGSGKELVAQALHRESGRKGRLVAFNVCAIPESMFEDVLFGHVRGAFTGALSDAVGYAGEADRGTLFLDEIGALPLSLQAKLLRVVETKQFRPVGAPRDRQSDFRVVSATNELLENLVISGRFRADLAYRLSGVVINVPLLQDRKSDIRHLCQHFLHQSSNGSERKYLANEAFAVLEQYAWPGNVRELRSIIERAIALTDATTIGRDEIIAVMPKSFTVSIEIGTVDMERRELVALLDRLCWDTASVARHLGVHWTTVYRRMKKLGISRQHERTMKAQAFDDMHLASY